jgi:hypothetical protein
MVLSPHALTRSIGWLTNTYRTQHICLARNEHGKSIRTKLARLCLVLLGKCGWIGVWRVYRKVSQPRSNHKRLPRQSTQPRHAYHDHTTKMKYYGTNNERQTLSISRTAASPTMSTYWGRHVRFLVLCIVLRWTVLQTVNTATTAPHMPQHESKK